MNKKIITIGAAALAALSVNAQGLVAGWDFADVANLSSAVTGYGAEKTAFNNGVATSGTLYLDGSNGSSSLTQGSEVFFASNGAQAGQPGFGDGFDQAASVLFGGAASGQQSVNFRDTDGSFSIVFGFSAATDVVVNFDWLTSTTGFTTDILNVSYSNDGSGFTAYEHPTNGTNAYWAGGSTASWTQSTGNLGGLAPAFGSGQADMTVDLTGLGEVSYVRLEFAGLAASERVGLDNVHVSGTASPIPEPSAFAAIAGMLALGFVAIRRRK